MNDLIEIVTIASLAVALPALALAMWHGWKFESHSHRHDRRHP